MKKTIFYILLLILTQEVFSQTEKEENKPEGIVIPAISVYYAYEFPGGDLEKRFGNNH